MLGKSGQDSPCVNVHAGIKRRCGSEGQFQKTAPRKTAENTVKLCDGAIGSVVANHRGGSESSVVVTTLLANCRASSWTSHITDW